MPQTLKKGHIGFILSICLSIDFLADDYHLKNCLTYEIDICYTLPLLYLEVLIKICLGI